MVQAVNDTTPVPDKVTVVDLGSKSCIPCKMVAPVLENLQKFHGDKAAIVFIDVRENQKLEVNMESTQCSPFAKIVHGF